MEFPVSATRVIKPDTTFFFKITHTDPTGAGADLTNDPAPYPAFFTGAQNVPVHFAVNGSIVRDAVTDSRGNTRAWLQGFAPGLHRVEVSSPQAGNTPGDPPRGTPVAFSEEEQGGEISRGFMRIIRIRRGQSCARDHVRLVEAR